MLTDHARRIAQAVFLALFVAWVSVGSWHSWQSSMPPPSQRIESRDRQHAIDESYERSAEKQIAYYTKWLAWFTGALVAVAGIQGYFLLRADKTARIAADAATQAARAAIGVELPKVFIENLEFQESSSGTLFENLQFVRVAISVKNYGRTPAFLRQQSAEMLIAGWPPEKPEYPNAHDLESGRIIEGGKTYDLPVARLRNEVPDDETINAIIEGKTNVWVYGYLFYRDFLNEPHRLGFCAQLVIHSSRGSGGHHLIECGPPKYTESY
jgi:hypothetical protein